jgi:hypothetical protein
MRCLIQHQNQNNNQKRFAALRSDSSPSGQGPPLQPRVQPATRVATPTVPVISPANQKNRQKSSRDSTFALTSAVRSSEDRISMGIMLLNGNPWPNRRGAHWRRPGTRELSSITDHATPCDQLWSKGNSVPRDWVGMIESPPFLASKRNKYDVLKI